MSSGKCCVITIGFSAVRVYVLMNGLSLVIFNQVFNSLLYNVLISRLLGGSPYPGMEGKTIPDWLKLGYRMPKPDHIDDKL